VALAPAIAALVGTAAVQLWRLRANPAAAGLLSGGLALTAITTYMLLSGSTWQPWLAPTVLAGGLLGAVALFFASHLNAVAGRAVAVLGLVVLLAGSGAYTLATAATPHSGAIPSAGPSGSGFGGRGGGPGGGFGGTAGAAGGRGGGMGGLLSATLPGPNLTALLQKDAEKYTWAAATVLSNNAAGYQLGSDEPVMAIGGFNGTDPYPTLAQFQEYVHNGQIHYFLGEGMAMSSNTGGSDVAQQIADWVASTYSASTVDGVTVYDLTTTG
jgi:hypothetical protein